MIYWAIDFRLISLLNSAKLKIPNNTSSAVSVFCMYKDPISNKTIWVVRCDSLGNVLWDRKLSSIGVTNGNTLSFVFGDIDGVCIIPQTAEEEVIRLALEKANGEKLVQKAIENGMSACDAFAKFGIM